MTPEQRLEAAELRAATAEALLEAERDTNEALRVEVAHLKELLNESGKEPPKPEPERWDYCRPSAADRAAAAQGLLGSGAAIRARDQEARALWDDYMRGEYVELKGPITKPEPYRARGYDRGVERTLNIDVSRSLAGDYIDIILRYGGRNINIRLNRQRLNQLDIGHPGVQEWLEKELSDAYAATTLRPCPDPTELAIQAVAQIRRLR